MPDDSQSGELGSQAREEPRGVVVAPIVHAHDLIRRQAVQRAPDLGQQARNVVGLVVDRHHHRQLRTHRSPPAQPANAG
jgi:hypothetical protein